MLEQIVTEINLVGGSETSLYDMAVRSPRTLELEYVSKYSELSNKQQILFFLRKFSYLHALLEPTCLFIFGENSHLHDY